MSQKQSDVLSAALWGSHEGVDNELCQVFMKDMVLFDNCTIPVGIH